MDRSASTCTHDNDGLCLPANTKARPGGTEKKESPVHLLNRACRRFVRLSLIDYHDLRRDTAHIVEEAYQIPHDALLPK